MRKLIRVMLLFLILCFFNFKEQNISGIDNTRDDLVIINSLKNTNQYGKEISYGSGIYNGE